MPLSALNKTITLYHGSIYLFDEINIERGKPYRNFGIGFYTTQEKSHAIRLALRNKSIEEKRLKRLKQFKPINTYLYEYSLDTKHLSSLNIKEFLNPDREWVSFILLNRTSINKTHDYDVITGATAGDDMRTSINAYSAGVYGEINSEDAIQVLINRLQSFNLPEQVYFGSHKAVSLLTRKGNVIMQ